MDLALPAEALNWQRRAKAFAEEHLFPHEIELEMNGVAAGGDARSLAPRCQGTWPQRRQPCEGCRRPGLLAA